MNEMTCREFDEIVHAFVRMELLDVNVREAALEHAGQCELCAERMADAAALAEASEHLARSAQDSHPPVQIQASLLAAFRNHHRRVSWRRTLQWASVGAVAAALLIFLWSVGGRSRVQSPAAPRKDVSSQADLPLDAKKSEVSAQKPAELVAHSPVPDSPLSENYTPSDFVPVPYTGAIAADDPGMIVRVQLTRSSLAQLGYPVAETPDEDLILADVLVGEDGWPRGVKLIQ